MDILKHFEQIIRGRYSIVVLELGGCDGFHTNLMLEIIKQKERPFVFHSFEPNQELHPKILNNIKGHLMFNDGIIGIFPHAIGAEVGEMTFYKSQGVKVEDGKEVDWYYGSSSIRKPKNITDDYPDMTFEESKVFVTTLDHHVNEHGLLNKQIDFIWADIQGAEVDMIAGGQETLKNVRYLYTEYIDTEHYEGQISKGEILKALPGFTIVEDYGGDILLRNMNLY